MDIYKIIGAFLLGVSAGAGGAYLYFCKKIDEQNAAFEEDLKALRQEYAKDFERFRNKDIERDLNSDNYEVKAKAQKEMAEIARNKDESMLSKQEFDSYTDYAGQYQPSKKKKRKGHIRMLREDDPIMNADSDYDICNCSFYADGVLSEDGIDKPIEDIKACVGTALERFNDEQTDEIYVANDRQKIVYDITRDIRRYWGDIRDGNMDDDI